MPLCSTLADAGLVPLYPFGVRRGGWGSRKGKVYKCAHCGMERDADVNAVVVILERAMAGARYLDRPAAVLDAA